MPKTKKNVTRKINTIRRKVGNAIAEMRKGSKSPRKSSRARKSRRTSSR